MSKRILIVEDDSFLQGLVATKLSKEGYEVVTASNSDDVSARIEEKAPDFVLLDLMLPGVDGFSVLKKIRENVGMRTTPIIVFSNLSEDSDIAKAKELGANDYMVKSNFTLDELASRIKETIG